jgi:hypothetical protein
MVSVKFIAQLHTAARTGTAAALLGVEVSNLLCCE